MENNQNENQNPVVPGPQPSPVPEHGPSLSFRPRIWYGMIVVVLLLAALGALLVWKGLDRQFRANNVQPGVTDNELVQSGTEQQTSGESYALYYYSSSEVYGLNLDSSQPDEKVLAIKGYINPFSRYLDKDQYLAGSDGKLLIMNLKARKTEELLSKPQDGEVGGAALSPDNKTLAYSLNFESYDESKVNGPRNNNRTEVWLMDVATKQKKKILDLNNLQLYVGLRSLAWNASGSTIIAEGLGGDAGAVWGHLYVIDPSQNNKYRAIAAPKSIGHSFLLGKLSPDGERWLYAYCDRPAVQQDIGDHRCPAGDELYIYHFKTARHEKIYQNTNHEGNVYAERLRVIYDHLWLNDHEIAVSVPGAIYKINLAKKQLELLLSSDIEDVEKIHMDTVGVIWSSDNYLAFRRYNNASGVFLLDLRSKKVTQVGAQLGSNLAGFLPE
jgi:hypothetical protein